MTKTVSGSFTGAALPVIGAIVMPMPATIAKRLLVTLIMDCSFETISVPQIRAVGISRRATVGREMTEEVTTSGNDLPKCKQVLCEVIK
jgi:hypothetical protein